MTNPFSRPVAQRPAPPCLRKPFMPMMQGWRWLVLALWGLLPLFCQAQTACASAFDANVTFSTIPMTNKTTVVMRTAVTLTPMRSGSSNLTCYIFTSQLMAREAERTYSCCGLTLDYRNTILRLRSNVPTGCRLTGDGTSILAVDCDVGSGNNARLAFDIEYPLVGKSTLTTSGQVFTYPNLAACTPNNTFCFGSFGFPAIPTPVSTAPTCSTTINPTNLVLGTITPTDLSGAVGSFTPLGQKPFNLTMTCMANALTQASTFVPTFQFNNPLTAGTYDIARAVTTDPGFGFRVLDPSGNAIKSGVALSSVTFPFTTPASAQSISRSFTVQYAKTLSDINPGVASSTITVTISFQ